MHTPKRIPRQDFPDLIRNWWWLLSYGGAEQRDEAFHHLSLPVILLPLTWSPELAKANYLGQTVSISKHSQQIAFHYWHARQAQKLPSTHRDRQSTSGPNLDPHMSRCPNHCSKRMPSCSRSLLHQTGQIRPSDFKWQSLFAHSSAISKTLLFKISSASETTTEVASETIQKVLFAAPKQPSEVARILGVNRNQSASDSKRWKINWNSKKVSWFYFGSIVAFEYAVGSY